MLIKLHTVMITEGEKNLLFIMMYEELHVDSGLALLTARYHPCEQQRCGKAFRASTARHSSGKLIS
jgi:hypothetical protein